MVKLLTLEKPSNTIYVSDTLQTKLTDRIAEISDKLNKSFDV